MICMKISWVHLTIEHTTLLMFNMKMIVLFRLRSNKRTEAVSGSVW